MKPVEKIFEAILAQAKQGSCKTCRWCAKQPTLAINGGLTRLTHYCMIQGNVNPIDFTDESLAGAAYPWKTEFGDWHTADEWEDVEGCLAYYPGYDGTMVDDPELTKASHNHRDFMVSLNEAMQLYYAMQNNTFAKLTAKINAATDSLPEPSWKEKHNVVSVGQPVTEPRMVALINKILESPDGTVIDMGDLIDKGK